MQDPVLLEIIKNQGRLEAKLDMLLEMEMSECADDGDSADMQPETAGPVTYSGQLETADLPPIF